MRALFFILLLMVFNICFCQITSIKIVESNGSSKQVYSFNSVKGDSFFQSENLRMNYEYKHEQGNPDNQPYDWSWEHLSRNLAEFNGKPKGLRICSGQPVPLGWNIVGKEKNCNDCNNGLAYYVENLKLLRLNSIAYIFPGKIPLGWVVVKQVYCNDCSHKGQIMIKRIK